MIEITPEGTVLKDGEELGIIQDGIMLHAAPISGVVKGQIRKAADNEELTFQQEKPVEGGAEPPPVQPLQISDAELLRLAQARGLMPAPAAAPKPVTNPSDPDHKTEKQLALEALFRRVQAGEIPKPPKTRPELGNKDPLFVDWVTKHVSPEDYKAIYPPHRKLPTEETHRDAQNRLMRATKIGEGDKGHEIRI